MIYVVGDTHCPIDIKKLNNKEVFKACGQYPDYVIICGDAGFIWSNDPEDKEEQYWLNWIDEKPWTTLFVDGNHCHSKDTDILTEFGWFNIEEIYNRYNIGEKIKLAQYDITTKEISYDYPLESFKNFSERVKHIKSKDIEMKVTEGHHILYKNKKISVNDLEKLCHVKQKDILEYGIVNNNKVNIEDNWIKLLTWTIMDGTIVDNSKYMPNSKKIRVQFKLSRKDKIENLSRLLNEMRISYTYRKATKSKTNVLQPYYIRIYGDFSKDIYERLERKKQIPSSWKNFSKDQLQIFLETLIQTDGSIINNRVIWRTISKNDVDVITESCIKNGYICKFITVTNASGFKSKKVQYHTTIIKEELIKNSEVYIGDEGYNNYVYCFSMLKGTLITRYKGKTIISGNSNHYRLNKLASIEMFNGIVGQVSNKLIHLRRGQVYTIEDKKFFCMGGAESTDKESRSAYIDWWPEEVPSYKDFYTAQENLEKVSYNVDYVISHTTPVSIMKELFKFSTRYKDSTCIMLEELKNKINFKKWFFGHMHQNCTTSNFYCLYEIGEVVK